MTDEFEEGIRRELRKAGDDVEPKRDATRTTGKDTDITVTEIPGKSRSGNSKYMGVVLPHLGYKRAIKLICAHYGVTQQTWFMQVIQAGIYMTMENDPEIERMVKNTSFPLWEELQEIASDDTAKEIVQNGA